MLVLLEQIYFALVNSSYLCKTTFFLSNIHACLKNIIKPVIVCFFLHKWKDIWKKISMIESFKSHR